MYLARMARYSGRYRPACRIIQTGVRSTASPRQVFSSNRSCELMREMYGIRRDWPLWRRSIGMRPPNAGHPLQASTVPGRAATSRTNALDDSRSATGSPCEPEGIRPPRSTRPHPGVPGDQQHARFFLFRDRKCRDACCPSTESYDTQNGKHNGYPAIGAHGLGYDLILVEWYEGQLCYGIIGMPITGRMTGAESSCDQGTTSISQHEQAGLM